MAQVRTPVLSGITEFGSFITTVDTTWGATERNGVSIAIEGEDVDVQSGQALMLEDSFASQRSITITPRLQFSGLLNVRDALGLPASALVGDIAGATDEVLSIVDADIASETKGLYAITPGPVSTRRFEFVRCKQRGGFTMELASNDYIRMESSWGLLRPVGGGFAMKVTDSAT